jgi:hypothetical protein
MQKRLEHLLDVRAHSEECARRVTTIIPQMFAATTEWLASNIPSIVPEFPLRDDANQRIWADVLSARIGVRPDDLLAVYRAYIRSLDEADDEFASRPLRAEVYWRTLPKEDALGFRASYMDPTELARTCAALIDGGAHEAWFHVSGQGRAIRGDATGWRRVCRCGQWLCPRHGTPQPTRPEWHDKYDPRLWPWVGVVPDSAWHSIR